MNSLFGTRPPGSDLLAALVRQSQPLRHFGMAEKEAEEAISHLSEALDQSLYQAGGLLNEQMLQPFFANPLPDVPLATALKNRADPRGNPLVDEPTLPPEREVNSGRQFLNQTSAQAELKAKGYNPLNKKVKPSSDNTQILKHKVSALQESKIFSDSRSPERKKDSGRQFLNQTSAQAELKAKGYNPLNNKVKLSSDNTQTLEHKMSVLQESKIFSDPRSPKVKKDSDREFLSESSTQDEIKVKSHKPQTKKAKHSAGNRQTIEHKVSALQELKIHSDSRSPKGKIDSVREFLSETSVQDELTVKSHKPQTKKAKLSTDNTQTLAHKSSALQESKIPSDSSVLMQRATDATQFADWRKKTVTRKRTIEGSEALPMQPVQSKLEPINASRISDLNAINRQQAMDLLDRKWGSQAWHTPIKTVSKSVHIESSSAEEVKMPSGQGEMPLLATEKKLGQKITQILAQRANDSRQKISPDTSAKINPKPQNELLPDSNEIPQSGPFADPGFGYTDVAAFTPAPSSCTKPERLVGLRGLAARATANDPGASGVGHMQSGTGSKQMPAIAQFRSPAATLSQYQEHGQANSTQAMSVSELAQVIAQEAKRAGINLEQFEP